MRQIVRRQRGITLVELMVVVAIVGVMVATALAYMGKRAATSVDEAQVAAEKLREASRKAISAGAVREDVAVANAIAERTRVRITTSGGRTALVLERVDEDPLPATTFSWLELNRHWVDEGIELFGFANQTALVAGAVTPIVLASDVAISCNPDGLCEPMTLFYQDRRQGQRMRVVVMPCNGTPTVFSGW